MPRVFIFDTKNGIINERRTKIPVHVRPDPALMTSRAYHAHHFVFFLPPLQK